MPIDIEEIIARAFEQAFAKALEQTLTDKAEGMFRRLLENGSPLAKKLDQKIEEGMQRFMEEGIRWERKKAGFRR